MRAESPIIELDGPLAMIKTGRSVASWIEIIVPSLQLMKIGVSLRLVYCIV
jgi:hypothetical protein